ncbi:hypothetical protein GCM10022409_35880 [Hymenobacter glaciei]|uniref:Uncharacterized protein n=1 Tax=Hymenobacter glaciei TaxID=877209 RepID=A0ABP7ULA2_9BACT
MRRVQASRVSYCLDFLQEAAYAGGIDPNGFGLEDAGHQGVSGQQQADQCKKKQQVSRHKQEQ